MSFAQSLYNNVFKRTSTYALTVVFGAFLFERTFDLGTEVLFQNMNKGKLWNDIKKNYE